MANAPVSVEVRAYQVGFGDCFLVTFVYPKTKRHVLIDFGTTGLPGTLQPSTHMRRIADAIEAQCEGQLTAVVATHRHADHISGFATDTKTGKSGEVIARCNPKLVLQPWTEDPDAAHDATRASRDSNRSRKSFVASLSAMHAVASGACELARRPPPTMSAALAKQLGFLGQDNLRNISAVKNLMDMGAKDGVRAVWARHGSKSGLERLLPGVKVHVLGPPDLTQTGKIRKMRSKDPDQFWMLLGAAPALQRMRIASVDRGADSNAGIPADARWFRDRLAMLTGEQMLEIVRTLDDQMNNTSLILLFEIGGTKLLFPGDAQIENWSYALEDAPDAEETKKLLRDVDFYKVGHHGSRNATPKALLWDHFSRRGDTPGKRLQTMLSTMSGKHGQASRDTEVPRRTLVDALKNETDLTNTQELGAAQSSPLCELVTVAVAKAAPTTRKARAQRARPR